MYAFPPCFNPPLILTHSSSLQSPTLDVLEKTEQLRNAGFQVVCVTDILYGTTKDLWDPEWPPKKLSNFMTRILHFVGKSGACYVFCSERQATKLSDIYRGLCTQIGEYPSLAYLLNYVSLLSFPFLLSITCN
jgi:hypothetical protein